MAVGLTFGKAGTEAPESRMKLDLAFPRNNGGRSSHFPVEEEPARLVTSSIFTLSLIHISEPTRLGMISYAVFCLKKKK